MRVGLSLMMLVTLLAGCFGCSGGGDTKARNKRVDRESASAGGSAVKTVNPAESGTITGKVLYDGTPPAREKLTMTEPVCQAPWKGEAVFREDVVVGPGGGLRYAVVYLDVADKYAAPATPFLIDQLGCMYVPHVFAVQAGQPLEIKSSDETLHNVHIMAIENPEANIAMPKPEVQKRKFAFPEFSPPIKIKCDVHPWMSAHAAVFEHPFFAVSAEDGSYTIANAPAGTHKVRLWTEACGVQEQSVTVAAGQTASVEFKCKKR